MRLIQMLRLLNGSGWRIDFIADDGHATPSAETRLAELGVRLVRESPLRWLAQQGNAINAVMLCRLPVADQYLDIVRHRAPAARIIFDTVDLHFIRERRAAEITGAQALLRQANRSRRRELAMVEACDITLVVSDDERLILEREAPTAHVEVVSNIHEAHGRDQGYHGRSGLLFVGGFGHPPNGDAVRWFIADVLPLLREKDPSIILHVAGDIDEESRRSIEHPGVIVHGRVADLRPLLASSLVSVAPLRFGAGVKGKVNQAMSHGLPVVLTEIAAEGMHLNDGKEALVANTPSAMADAILRLHRDESLWMALSEAGLENVRQHFSVERAGVALSRAMEHPFE
ncbi:glycosyltransferase family 4 protein [Luteibacter sp.]|uniref:glycosyltransferase n=1 Tax=Luteibacter sp. TaxID=1886636 RepID=UPI0025BAA974|nr:glycosyltransferase family 4 protein [Luteibacter sp.]